MSFDIDEDTEGVFIISGKSWEGESFKMYLTEEEAKNLIWQMTYYISNPEFE